MRAISIIVPTLNESENIPLLLERIADSFKGSGITYEMIFVDDNSTDDTQQIIRAQQSNYPLSLHIKAGPRGKAYSLLQGFKLAQYNAICMIDADLQYPPEAIVQMYKLMDGTNIDVVLTERGDYATSAMRRIVSKGFNFVFTRLLFGFKYDSQSGLKLFRKHVIDSIELQPTPWSFDLEFIVRALEKNYKILSYKIPFAKRYGGQEKVQVFKVAYELARASLWLRLHSSPRKIRQAYKKNLKLAAQVPSNLTAAIAVALAASLMIVPTVNSAAITASAYTSTTATHTTGKQS